MVTGSCPSSEGCRRVDGKLLAIFQGAAGCCRLVHAAAGAGQKQGLCRVGLADLSTVAIAHCYIGLIQPCRHFPCICSKPHRTRAQRASCSWCGRLPQGEGVAFAVHACSRSPTVAVDSVDNCTLQPLCNMQVPSALFLQPGQII